jgi:hypothetical protein
MASSSSIWEARSLPDSALAWDEEQGSVRLREYGKRLRKIDELVLFIGCRLSSVVVTPFCSHNQPRVFLLKSVV